MRIQFSVPGVPQGKARPRVTRAGHAYTPQKTRAYETVVRQCYLQTAGLWPFPDGAALCVHIVASYPIPKGTSKKDRQSMLEGKILPTKKPDADNIAKIILDALNGYAYKDDACVVSLSVIKAYSETPHVTVMLDDYYSWGNGGDVWYAKDGILYRGPRDKWEEKDG